MGDDIGSGLLSMAVCFDFRSTNVAQLSNCNLFFYRFWCHHPLIIQLRPTCYINCIQNWVFSPLLVVSLSGWASSVINVYLQIRFRIMLFVTWFIQKYNVARSNLIKKSDWKICLHCIIDYCMKLIQLCNRQKCLRISEKMPTHHWKAVFICVTEKMFTYEVSYSKVVQKCKLCCGVLITRVNWEHIFAQIQL